MIEKLLPGDVCDTFTGTVVPVILYVDRFGWTKLAFLESGALVGPTFFFSTAACPYVPDRLTGETPDSTSRLRRRANERHTVDAANCWTLVSRGHSQVP
jgi:hypothetical protein